MGGLKYQLPVADQVFESEMEIKRSRFLTYITRVQSEDEARDFITLVREMFPDARHHCSAYIYHVDDSNDVERSSDDGEPSGTAGKPMLEALRGSGMKDIAAVVVRYFGGIKLGTGGLVNAYTNAVTSTLINVPHTTRSVRDLFTVHFSHNDAGRIESNLRGLGVVITDTDYGADVQFTLALEPGDQTQVESQLSSLAGAEIELKESGKMWVESPSD
ncbi:YigZ family protein [uncultured Corynebacterium sp.]|uniref:YigZ family protein n=1 Tax=uncultured Corynebacterium sp. TaxID=159447 RepID=UPI0025E36A5C|nr:YigZ family protein [uncultured Corynebacterium sp.]